jgi:hypothetical protein
MNIRNIFSRIFKKHIVFVSLKMTLNNYKYCKELN